MILFAHLLCLLSLMSTVERNYVTKEISWKACIHKAPVSQFLFTSTSLNWIGWQIYSWNNIVMPLVDGGGKEIPKNQHSRTSLNEYFIFFTYFFFNFFYVTFSTTRTAISLMFLSRFLCNLLQRHSRNDDKK